MMAVVTGFGVIFAISASKLFAPASVCLASTTMTLVLPMIIVLLPPAPPRPAQTSGFNCFMVIGGGACGCCCATTVESAMHIIAIAKQSVFGMDIRRWGSFRGPLYYRKIGARRGIPRFFAQKTGECPVWPRFSEFDAYAELRESLTKDGLRPLETRADIADHSGDLVFVE